ncbi:mitochondrial ribosomal protein subunit L23 [Boeremia exigua]|uniref:mitochondrial ribosomal protein subunit L23 n=1 Tax=Boeremia exigua TaxID=749465 RepID=UPI001E8EEA1D|nr:mitochondrial ribosomal protein subunit L23 [Boeremia exigua]KAH6615043.1 mitochondrial ribosomal protein subunit L23 [Boeremia exigua]
MDAVPISKKLIAFGSKKIFLPKFTVAMVRTHGLSPYHARFFVPLDFSKYDLRDYLYHAYNVRCFNIRSYVKQMPVRDAPDQPRHWFRPESKKYMTVEMEQPFVWPALPEDTKPWGVGTAKAETEAAARSNGIVTMEQKRESARLLREKVKKLLTKQEPVLASSIGKKLDQNIELTPKEKDTVQAAVQRKADNKKMPALDFWERKRSMKVVEADDSSRYTIKV